MAGVRQEALQRVPVERADFPYNSPMRWILTILISLMVLMTLVPWLSKFGLGRLPGDINFSIRGRRICIPIASTVLIVLAAFLLGRLF